MKYAITNTSGQWWNGSCWGVKQVREEYTAADLPGEIDGYEKIDNGDTRDIVYCDMDEEPGNDIVAGVREIREAGDPL